MGLALLFVKGSKCAEGIFSTAAATFSALLMLLGKYCNAGLSGSFFYVTGGPSGNDINPSGLKRRSMIGQL